MIYTNYHPKSENLRASSYNTDTRILKVLFKSGWLYFYYNFSKSKFDELGEKSPKGGKWFHQNVRFNYTYRAINRDYSLAVTNIPHGISADNYNEFLNSQPPKTRKLLLKKIYVQYI